MAFFHKKRAPQAQQPTAVSGITIQSSALGKARPLGFGKARLAPNLIWYGDFRAIAHQSQPASGGGKGGVTGGGGGKGGGGSQVTYTYEAAVAFGLCEGPIRGIDRAWASKSITNLSGLGLTLFVGAYPQTPWSYLSTAHPAQAIGYTGLAYVAAGPYNLGDSAQLPQHNFEVEFPYSDSIAGKVDADPSLVLAYLLSDAKNGAGFPASRIASLATYQSYCIASGLWISPIYQEQASAESMLADILKFTNSEAFWSEGLLKVQPYGDQAITANGHTYTPPSAPEYDLTDDDFIADGDDDPVLLTRERPSDKLNVVALECLNRAKEYNSEIVEAKNQAAIDLYGVRSESAQNAHLFCDTAAAQMSAQLMLQRQEVLNLYAFKVSARYMRLDPMDIVTITDVRLGLDRQWVRIRSISEDENGDLAIEAEEYLAGTGAAALNTFGTSAGYSVDYNASAGNVNRPIFIEPLAPMTQGALEIWLGVSGGASYGGADVWVSDDGETYRFLGRATSPCRQGVLTAALPAVPRATTGPTIDTASVLAIDLGVSRGELLPGTESDALALNTLVAVGQEFIAYRDAVLTAPYRYNLDWLIRGAHGSGIVAANIGDQFLRLDGSLFSIPFTPDRIGQSINVKLLSVNQFGGGLQSLADVEPFPYVIRGDALAGPLANVVNFRSVYVDDLTQLAWDQIVDFRPVEYEIRKGGAFDGAQILGRVQSPPFPAHGNGTYWIVARSQPTPDLVVYSPAPASLAITGAALAQNIIATWDEEALGWPGALDGGVAKVGGIIVTAPAGNILTIADWLAEPDILNYGGFAGQEGTYTIPSGHRINVGRVAPCVVNFAWTSRGQRPGQNILAIADYLGVTDLLDAAASANVDVYPEIRTAGDDGVWGAWERHTPGHYNARHFDGRMRLKSRDVQTQAQLTDMVFSVDVPDIFYVGTNAVIDAAGNNISFPAAFNGGPDQSTGVGTPNIQVTILNAQAGDDVLLTNQTLSGFTLRVMNGGAGVQRNVNWRADGW